MDGTTLDIQHTKPRDRLYSRQRGEPAVTMVKLDRCRNVYIRDAIPIGQTKSVVVYHMVGHFSQPPPGATVFSCIHQSDMPRFRGIAMHFHSVVGHVESDIGRV